MLTESGLTLITGTMFSGKSTELIRRIKRLEAAEYPIQLFKPRIDDRYDLNHVTSHDGFKKEAIYVSSVDEIITNLDPKTQVIGIDEIQFLESKVVQFCDQQAMERIVLVAGLLKNFQDNYFSFRDGNLDTSELLRIADHIVYLNAICTHKKNGKRCKRNATQVQRLIEGKVVPYHSPIVLVGGKEAYEPRCRLHFKPYEQVQNKLQID